MDTSSAFPALVLGLSLALYFHLTLVEEVLLLHTGGGAARRERAVGPVGVLLFWRLGALLAAATGLLVLLLSVHSSWAAIGGASFALLLVASAAPAALRALVRRAPSLCRLLARPVLRLVSTQALPPMPDGEKVSDQGGDASTPQTVWGLADADHPGAPDEREQRMIRAILAMGRTTVREVMVPRLDIVGAEVDTPVLEVVKLMLDTGHSRLLVYRETMDDVVGTAHALDILGLLGERQRYPLLRELLRQPFFVPEYKRLDELLQEFQERHVHVAVVVDEHGGVEGLVTMEDLLEEIVGDIEDEFARGEPEVVLVNESTTLVDARTPLTEVNERLGIELQMQGVDTIGGYVYGVLGRMPHVGNRLEAAGVRIEVVSTMGHRLRKLRIIKLPPPGAAE